MGSSKDDFPLEWLSGKPLPSSDYKRSPSWTDGHEAEFKKPDFSETRTWVKVVGVTKYQDAFKHFLGARYGKAFAGAFAATAIEEKDNPHDRNAVQVFVGSMLIGYLEREATWIFTQATSRGLVHDGKLKTTVHIEGDGEFQHDGKVVYWAKIDFTPLETRLPETKPQLTGLSKLFFGEMVIPKQVLQFLPVLLALAAMLWMIRGCSQFISRLPKSPPVQFDSKNGTNSGGVSSKSSYPKYAGIEASKSLLKEMTDYKLTFPWTTPTVEDTGVEMRIVRGTVSAGPYEWKWHVTWQWQDTQWRPTEGSLGPHFRQFAASKPY